jgi:hypothetical protein
VANVIFFPLKQIVVDSSIYFKKNNGDSFIHQKKFTKKVEEEELSGDSPGYNRITILADSNRVTLQKDGMGTWKAKDYPVFQDSLQQKLDSLTDNEIRIMEENELKLSKFYCNELPPEEAEEEALKIEGIKETLHDNLLFGGAIEMMMNHQRRDELMALMGVAEVPT